MQCVLRVNHRCLNCCSVILEINDKKSRYTVITESITDGFIIRQGIIIVFGSVPPIKGDIAVDAVIS